MSPRSPMKEWSGQSSFERPPEEKPKPKAEREAAEGGETAEPAEKEREDLGIDRAWNEDELKQLEAKLELLSSSYEKQYRQKGRKDLFESNRYDLVDKKQEVLSRLVEISRKQGDKEAESKYAEDLELANEELRRMQRE